MVGNGAVQGTQFSSQPLRDWGLSDSIHWLEYRERTSLTWLPSA